MCNAGASALMRNEKKFIREREVLYIQTTDNPNELTEEERKAAIEFNGRTLFFIMWEKK